MPKPAGGELQRRWTRAKLGALIWLFFGLLISFLLYGTTESGSFSRPAQTVAPAANRSQK